MKKIIILFLLNLLSSNQLNIESSYIIYTGIHPFHTWQGTSKEFICNIKEEKNGYYTIFISALLNSFDSNNENRDSNMLYYTESLKYPNVTFISDMIKFEQLYNLNSIQGKLNFHGIEKSMIIDVDIIENDLNFIGQCFFKIDLNEFEIEIPKLLMLPINNIIDINAEIIIKK